MLFRSGGQIARQTWTARRGFSGVAYRRAERLDFARSILSDLGFRGRQLEMRARLFVGYHTWEQATFADLSKKERRALLRLRHKLLVSR